MFLLNQKEISCCKSQEDLLSFGTKYIYTYIRLWGWVERDDTRSLKLNFTFMGDAAGLLSLQRI